MELTNNKSVQFRIMKGSGRIDTEISSFGLCEKYRCKSKVTIGLQNLVRKFQYQSDKSKYSTQLLAWLILKIYIYVGNCSVHKKGMKGFLMKLGELWEKSQAEHEYQSGPFKVIWSVSCRSCKYSLLIEHSTY